MATKKRQKRKHYSAEFKLNAVKMSLKPGRTLQDVAIELGIAEPTLSKWRFEFKQKEDFKAAQEALQAKQENDKLKSENKRLKMEVEILKQAAIYFAGQK